MKSKTKIKLNIFGGFMALIAVILLATGTLAFSLVTMSSAAAYADSVERRERRIQATLNARACLDAVQIMTAKDYYIFGAFELKEYGCNVTVNNDLAGRVLINIVAAIGDISVKGKVEIQMDDNSIFVISSEVF
jgi:hypothetical protein